MPPSSMNDLFAFLSQLMTEHAGLFETMGPNMFRGFAVILIAWYGVKGALASASGGAGHGFRFENFASLLMTIAFGFGMITYYSQPIPGFGVSFYHLIVDQGLDLSNQLEPLPGSGDLGPVGQSLLEHGDARYWCSMHSKSCAMRSPSCA